MWYCTLVDKNTVVPQRVRTERHSESNSFDEFTFNTAAHTVNMKDTIFDSSVLCTYCAFIIKGQNPLNNGETVYFNPT